MSHSEITNDTLVVAPSDIPSRPRGWEMSEPGQGPEGLMKKSAPPFSALTTITLELPEEESPDLYSFKPSKTPTMQVPIRSNGHPYLK